MPSDDPACSLAATNGGKPLGQGRFFKETGIAVADWRGRYWTKWSDAILEAGLEPIQMQARTDDDEAIRRLAIEVRTLGRLPTHAELMMRRRRDMTFPSPYIYERLGPKMVLAGRVAAYCEAHSEFADVLEIVTSLLDGDVAPKEKVETDEPGERG